MNLHKFIVLFCITIAALMNSRAPYAALAGFSGEWRWIIAIAVSFPLVYFTEWAIAYDVAISSIKRDIHHDQEQIEAKKRNTKNQLIAVRAEAEQIVFNAVLKDYLHQKTKIFVVFATGLLIVEYAATLFYVRFQGEDTDWIIYIVPLLGIILTIMTGFYTGKIIRYPEYKRQISQKFDAYYQQRYQENPDGIKHASREFWVLEELTKYVLDHPQSTPEQRNQKENQVWIELLIHQYNQVLKQGQKAIQEKRRQLNQSPVGLISREAWETAINEEIKAIIEEFQLELYQIQSELKRRGYSMESNQVLSTEKMNSIKPPKWQLKPDSHS
jgi:hypothetical protein